MVSLDDAEKNKQFADSVGAGFTLLSDPEKENAKAYGVLGLGGFWAKRWTFFIDDSGIIRHIDKDVKTATHGADVVKQLRVLGLGVTSEAPAAGD
jgi:peroxiredoxin Q/BCP